MIAKQLFSKLGFNVCIAEHVTNALRVSGRGLGRPRTVKVKLSLLWEDNSFAFEQIYKDRGYSRLMLIGLVPYSVLVWCVPTKLVWQRGALQHGTETRWLKFHIDETPTWLADRGGDLSTEAIDRRIESALF